MNKCLFLCEGKVLADIYRFRMCPPDYCSIQLVTAFCHQNHRKISFQPEISIAVAYIPNDTPLSQTRQPQLS
jgi:hypothetical protein